MTRLDDEGEFDHIRNTYFKGKPIEKTQEEQEEAWERADAKNKPNQNR